MKWSVVGCALGLGVGFTSTALSKPYTAGTPFQVNSTVQNSNPILQRAVLGHYSSDPSVIEITDSSNNRLLVMVSSSDLVSSDAGNWPMNQTYLYAVNNSQAFDPIVTTWYDHGPVVSEANFTWVKQNTNRLWAPDIQYYSSTNDIWLYIPDRDANGVFRIGMAHAAVSNGLYSDGGFVAEQAPITITGAPNNGTGTAFDPGVYSDQVQPVNPRTFLTYADREFGDGSGNNLSMAELGADHKTVISYLGKIKFTGALAAYTGLTKYMEGPDIQVMQMPGRGGRLFYYLVFATNVENADKDDTGYIGYAMCSDQAFHAAPATCWQFKGWIFRNMRTGRSNHPSLINYGGTHYMFYHTAPTVCCSPQNSRARQVAVKEFQVIDHQGFDDDGEIVGVTHPTGSDNINDATKYGTLDGLSTTLQPAFISVRDEDTGANSETLDFTNFVNPSTYVTLKRGLDRLYYYFDADSGQNVQVTQPTNVTQSGLVLDAPPIRHLSGNTFAIVMEYNGGDVPPGALSSVNVQLRVTGNAKANDFSRALGNYVTPTTRLLLSDLNNGLLAGEAPNNSSDNFKVLYTNHQDGNGQFTYLTTSFSNPNVGINNQYLMTGSQSQDWYLEQVTDFSNLQGLGPLSPTDKLNAYRLRCKWTNLYMTSNDVQKGTAAQPSFWVLSQALNSQWSTQVWIKEAVGDGSVRLRSAWLPDAARDSSRAAIYLTLQAATSTGKQDVFVQLNTNLDRQHWVIE
jgi:hypothetical protein